MSSLLNVTAIFTVAFRLAPFILTSYFVFASLANGDIRGLLFLCMMLMNVFLTVAVGAALGPIIERMGGTEFQPNRFGSCYSMNLTQAGPLSPYFPLNVNVFSFTLGYVAEMFNQGTPFSLGDRSTPLVLVLSGFLVAQAGHMYLNRCAAPGNILASIGCGLLFGYVAAWILFLSDYKELQYFSLVSRQDVCQRNAGVSFTCSG